MKNEIQYRFAPEPMRSTEAEARKVGGPMKIAGYAALYESTTSLGQFDEVLAAGAFDESNLEDVRFLVDHTGLPLGRTSAGTMTVTPDARGLRYEVSLPDTNRGRELYEAVRRGDISQSSFAFTIDKERWTEKNGRLLRTIERVGLVLDASAVTYPAYELTSVQVV